jgi:hypothetical protein
MEASLHRKIVIISSVALVLSLVWIIAGSYIIDSDINIIPLPVFAYAFLAMVSSFAIRLQDNLHLRRVCRWVWLPTILLVILNTFLAAVTGDLSGVMILLIVITFLLALLWVIQLFIYSRAESITTIVIFLSLLVGGIFFKPNHWPLAGFIITCFSSLLSAGIFMFGIRCLYLAGRKSHFSRLTFIGSCVISIAYMGLMFKMQHWAGNGGIIIIGFTGLIAGTLFILLTLPSSGYIDWQPLFKRIFRKILIPWSLILFLYVARFMIPELNAVIFGSDQTKASTYVSPYAFGMEDYAIEDQTKEEPE